MGIVRASDDSCNNAKEQVRTGIYIGLGDAVRNKALFDALSASCETIEREFGEPLKWERLDDKLGRCCTNRHWPARCPPPGSSPADTIRHWSAEGGHPIQDRTAENGLTPHRFA